MIISYRFVFFILLATFSSGEVSCQGSSYKRPLFRQYKAWNDFVRNYPSNHSSLKDLDFCLIFLSGANNEYSNSVITVRFELSNFVEARYTIGKQGKVLNYATPYDSNVVEYLDQCIVVKHFELDDSVCEHNYTSKIYRKQDTITLISFHKNWDTVGYNCFVVDAYGIVRFSRTINVNVYESTADSIVYYLNDNACELRFPHKRTELNFASPAYGKKSWLVDDVGLVTEDCMLDTFEMRGNLFAFSCGKDSTQPTLAFQRGCNFYTERNAYVPRTLFCYFNERGNMSCLKEYDKIVFTDSDTPLWQFDYHYDNIGRVTKITRLDGGKLTDFGFLFEYQPLDVHKR